MKVFVGVWTGVEAGIAIEVATGFAPVFAVLDAGMDYRRWDGVASIAALCVDGWVEWQPDSTVS